MCYNDVKISVMSSSDLGQELSKLLYAFGCVNVKVTKRTCRNIICCVVKRSIKMMSSSQLIIQLY